LAKDARDETGVAIQVDQSSLLRYRRYWNQLFANSPASEPNATLLLPVVLKERTEADGGILAAGGILKERSQPVAVFWLPVVLLRSASCPMAAFHCPVVLSRSALLPVAVLSLPVVLLRSA
jgi:hypothetical protein